MFARTHTVESIVSGAADVPAVLGTLCCALRAVGACLLTRFKSIPIFVFTCERLQTVIRLFVFRPRAANALISAIASVWPAQKYPFLFAPLGLAHIRQSSFRCATTTYAVTRKTPSSINQKLPRFTTLLE